MNAAELVPLDQCADMESLSRWWSDNRAGHSLVEINDARDTWEEEISSLPRDILDSLDPAAGWNWVVYPWLHAATIVPSAETTFAVLTSRNYPIISRSEQRALHDAYVVVVGLSTGRAVAQQLARLGIGRLLLVDGDHLAPSNSNRLVGTRLTDIGLPKVEGTARELWEYNPYLEIETMGEFLDESRLVSVCEDRPPDVIVEMIDGFPAKVAIREVARRFNVPVVMPTDMDWDPMVDVDHPDAPMFGGRLTETDIAIVNDPTTSFESKTEVAMRFMALDRWAPRSFLSGQLARNGLVSYWSQTVPSVATGAALVSRAVFDLVRGVRTTEARVKLSIRDPFRTADPLDMTEPLVKALHDAVGEIDFPEGHGW